MDEKLDTKFALPTFSGERDDFQLWWVRFEACCLAKGHSAALKPTPEEKLPADGRVALDLSTTTCEKAKAAMTRNNLAIAALTMAFATNSLMSKARKCRTEECPG